VKPKKFIVFESHYVESCKHEAYPSIAIIKSFFNFMANIFYGSQN